MGPEKGPECSWAEGSIHRPEGVGECWVVVSVMFPSRTVQRGDPGFPPPALTAILQDGLVLSEL